MFSKLRRSKGETLFAAQSHKFRRQGMWEVGGGGGGGGDYVLYSLLACTVPGGREGVRV